MAYQQGPNLVDVCFITCNSDGSFDIWIFIAQIHNKYCEKGLFFLFCMFLFVLYVLIFIFILRQDIFIWTRAVL